MVQPRDRYRIERMHELAIERFHGELTESQIVELSDLLNSSADVRQEYLRTIALHTRLTSTLDNRSDFLEGLLPETTEVTPATRSTSRRTPSLTGMQWLAISACLAFVFIGGRWQWQQMANVRDLGIAAKKLNDQIEVTPVLATISSISERSEWSFGRSGANNAEGFQQGDTIMLSAGAVQLNFPSQTVAVLESPAFMQLIGPDRMRVIQGNLKVEAADKTCGFVVETASAEVLDLGNSFAVNVADGETDVVVFDGEVDIKVSMNGASSGNQSKDPPRRLRSGEAVHVARDGTLSRIVTVCQTPLMAGATKKESHDSIITKVSDNNIRKDFWSFYEIIPSGMKEDAPAYVDRLHQWNGENKAGMPSYLLGGDYVKTFNDDKVDQSLVIDLTISKPATIYLLFDKRNSPPDWLLSSFEKMEESIGLDEVPHFPDNPEQDDPYRLGVGAGKSINRVYSIWKRDSRSPGTVSLGINSHDAHDKKGVLAESSMYGIVAVPLNVQD